MKIDSHTHSTAIIPNRCSVQAFEHELVSHGCLVAAWDFAEPEGLSRLSRWGRSHYALREVGGVVESVHDGPLGGGGVRFGHGSHLQIDYANTGDLNISGPDARLSIFALVKMDGYDQRGGTVAGMWSEGQGQGDDSGTRQYALLLDMNWYGGPKQVTPHVSAEGGATRRADGTMLPWCADYAATPRRYPVGRWCSMGMTYDGTSIRAYLDGVCEHRSLQPAQDNRDDRYFTYEGPDGGDRGMNPYYHAKGIYRHDPTRQNARLGGGSDFVVGAREVGGRSGNEPLAGTLGGLAVFDDSLSDEQMLALHRAALG